MARSINTDQQPRAIGVIRVSRTKGDDARSPGDQRARIEHACTNNTLRLIDVVEELDVSGGRSLSKRPGLAHAVEAVEAGAADVIVVAYFDRLVRSLAVQAEVVDRIEKAGGRVLTVDVGEISNGSAAQWLSATMLGMVAEYARRSVSERTADAKRDAVARGVAPFANVPPGIRRRDEDRVLEPDPEVAPLIRQAFELRAEGKTLAEVRSFLVEHGVPVTEPGTRSLLACRLYLGELRFGQHVNPNVFAPIVNRGLWRRVQAMKVPKGRYAKSERLLARLGVLRCANCGARLTVNSTSPRAGKTYCSYRCDNDDCVAHVTIAAELAEAEVVRLTKQLLEAAHGEASIHAQVRAAELALEQAEAARDALVDALTGIPGKAAVAKLRESQAAVEQATDLLADLQRRVPDGRRALSVADWDGFTFAERRRLITLALERVDVASAGPLAGAARLRPVPR
jgi:DNA invertase Pin-like site-specific DNA recombinase